MLRVIPKSLDELVMAVFALHKVTLRATSHPLHVFDCCRGHSWRLIRICVETQTSLTSTKGQAGITSRKGEPDDRQNPANAVRFFMMTAKQRSLRKPQVTTHVALAAER